MKFLNRLFDELDRFSGVVAAIIIIINILRFVYLSHPDYSPLVFWFLAVVCLFIVIFLTWKARRIIEEQKIKRLEKQIRKRIEEPLKHVPLKKEDLLSTKQIKSWLKTTDYHAKEWSYDAVRNESNMGYRVSYYGHRLDHSLHIEYYSELKKELLTFSYGRDRMDLAEANYEFNKSSYIPFYKNQKKWRDAVVAAYKHFEDKWDGSFSIFVCSVGEHGAGIISIGCDYTRGSKQIRTRGPSFEFDGKYLYNKDIRIEI